MSEKEERRRKAMLESLDNVIDFGEIKLKHDWKAKPGAAGCPHTHLLYSDNNQTIECAHCGQYFGAYKAFRMLVNRYESARNHIERKQAELNDALSSTLHRIAARKVDKAWRSKTMLPSCPHCRRGITPEDRFGSCLTNKAMEMARRKREGHDNA